MYNLIGLNLGYYCPSKIMIYFKKNRDTILNVYLTYLKREIYLILFTNIEL